MGGDGVVQTVDCTQVLVVVMGGAGVVVGVAGVGVVEAGVRSPWCERLPQGVAGQSVCGSPASQPSSQWASKLATHTAY